MKRYLSVNIEVEQEEVYSYFNVTVRHNDKVYQKREIISPDVLNSLFDRIFDKAKLAVKEAMEKEDN